MQGISHPIPTELKVRYLNHLLKVGFHTLDAGSFVSPRAVPQMADTAAVFDQLDLSDTSTRLLAIVANRRGAEQACEHPKLTFLGYPFSMSETFQLRNTRKTLAASMELVEQLQALCEEAGKQLVVYLSMAFGNPYGDPWSEELVADWAVQLAERGVGILSLADTVGMAEAEGIFSVFRRVRRALPGITLGGHFHAHPRHRKEKLQAAYEAGCRRFDVALRGFGGCPFAEDELVGNISTESLLEFCDERGIFTSLQREHLGQAASMVPEVFSGS